MKVSVLMFCLITFYPIKGISQQVKPFIISYIVYLNVEDYNEFFIDIYTELGFEVVMIPTPSIRGLILLNDGKVDADVVRIGNQAKKYANVIIAQPELDYANITLLCVKNKPCTREILGNEEITILTSERIISFLDKGEFKAQQASSELFSTVPSMLKANRYDYALYLMDDLLSQQLTNDFQSVKIKSMAINHVIHKKHIALLGKIEEKIRAKLPEFKRKRALHSIL